MDINTCYELTKDIQNVAYYTHLFPIFVSLSLSIYLLIKTKYSLLSKIFFYFSLALNVWLIADVITWTQQSYTLIQFVWSFFDYTNTIFFLLGFYFFIVLIRKKEIDWKWKLFGIILTLPALERIITGNSVGVFNQSVCESLNDNFLNIYKNYIEGFVVLMVLFFMGRTLVKEKNKSTRNQILFIGSAVTLFFATFAVTDYLSVSSDYYEFGLYGLFVLPVFLGLIVYSIVKYRAFNVGVLGAQALVVTLDVLIGAQFFFIQNQTNRVLNAITFLLAILFGINLVRGVKKEIDAREHIEVLAKDLQKANERLKELDKQKTEFISLATHQIRGPLGSIKGYASMILEGDFGAIPAKAKEGVDIMMKSAQALIIVVNDYLDVSRIEQGRMKFDFSDFDLKDLVKTVVSEFKPPVEQKGLELTFTCDEAKTYMVNADMGKIKQVISNLIDNSIKYTPKGSIHVALEQESGKNAGKLLISIKDTGVGIRPEVMPNLFAKFSRAPDASKTNILGTGLGLYVARKMIEAHKGRVWAESEGQDKGSQMYIELTAKA